MIRVACEMAGVLWVGLIHEASGQGCASRVHDWRLESPFSRDAEAIHRILFARGICGGHRVEFALDDRLPLTAGALRQALTQRLQRENVPGIREGHFAFLSELASVFESDLHGWAQSVVSRDDRRAQVDEFLAGL